VTFHVPESLRVQPAGWESDPGDLFGVFHLPTGARLLRILATDGQGGITAAEPWEHVSVSVRGRGGVSRPKLPTWDEMCRVKDLFWDGEDVVVQFHPARSQYVDNADVLHLWRWRDGVLPTPDPLLVGVPQVGRIASGGAR
jgi:hypothetical protein